MTTLILNARTFADLFPPEPPTAPMPVEVVRYEGPKPPPPPPEAFESAPRPVLAPSNCKPLAPFPSAPKAPARPKVKRQAKPTPPMGADPRLPSNVAPHVWASDGLQRRTPAQRRKLMSACPCRLCALALNPPLTFAEHTAFGGGAASFAQVRWDMRKLERATRAAIKSANEAGDAELAASLEPGGVPDPWKSDEAPFIERHNEAERLAHARRYAKGPLSEL